MAFRRAWGGDDWQAFALKLVQLRHGPQNVQIVPDTVKGDAGVEFFTTDGCLYQCYAPEEVSDLAKAASAMKKKARTDLAKLSQYQVELEAIFQGIKIRRWILLCPFLDNKDVIAAVRERGATITPLGLPFIASDFEALVHSLEDFVAEHEQLRILSLGPPLQLDDPSDDDVDAVDSTEVGAKLSAKLSRAYPSATNSVAHCQYFADLLHNLVRPLLALTSMDRVCLRAQASPPTRAHRARRGAARA